MLAAFGGGCGFSGLGVVFSTLRKSCLVMFSETIAADAFEADVLLLLLRLNFAFNNPLTIFLTSRFLVDLFSFSDSTSESNK